jgi:hypothetical protein
MTRDDTLFNAVVAPAEAFFSRFEGRRLGHDRHLKPLCYVVAATTKESCGALHKRSLQLASALQAHVNALTGAATDECNPLQLSDMLDAANKNQLDGRFPDMLRNRKSSSPIAVVVVGSPAVVDLPGDVPYYLHQMCDQTHAIVESNVYVLPVCLWQDGDNCDNNNDNSSSFSAADATAATAVGHDPVEAREWVERHLRATLGEASRLPRWADLDELLARVIDAVVLVGDSGDDDNDDEEEDCSSSSSSGGGDHVVPSACFHQTRLARALEKFGRELGRG